MEETKTNQPFPITRGVENTEEFAKFSDTANKLDALLCYVPDDVRDKVKASILTKLTEELNAFIEGGEIAKKHKEEEYDKDVKFFVEMVNKVISDEMEIIRKKYSLAGETLPGFYTLEFHGYRAAIFEHINHTILKGTRFLLAVKRTQIESALVEGLEGTGYKAKEKDFNVRYSLVLVDKFKDLDEEAKQEDVIEAPTTTTTKEPAKKVTKKAAKKK